LFDLGQVEVLRGPQGILFGKNTLAGAINVTSASAVIGDEMNGRVSVAAESYDGQTAEAVYQYASVRQYGRQIAAYRDRSDDGYMDNGFATAGNGATPTMPSTDEQIWRLSATWEPNDSTVVKLKHSESDFVRRGSTATLVRFQPEANIAASNRLMYGVMGQVFPTYGASVAAAGTGNTDGFRDSISIGGLALAQSLGRDLNETEEKPEGTDTQTAATSLTVEWELANGYTLTSVTGSTGYEYEDGIDADFLPVSFIGRSDISEYDQFSQEIRLASPTDGNFSWIAGGQMQSAEQVIDRTVIFDGTVGQPGLLAALTGCRTFLAVPGGGCVNGVTAFDKSGRVSTWKTETDSFAVFLQGTYDITDTLSLTAGVRYTEEEKDVYTKVDIVQDAALVDGVMVNDIRNLATPDTNPYNAALNGATFDSYAHEFDEDRKTDQLMPALSLEWEMSDTSYVLHQLFRGLQERRLQCC
jgi:outer membrane receptor protein involved in Fe transport